MNFKLIKDNHPKAAYFTILYSVFILFYLNGQYVKFGYCDHNGKSCGQSSREWPTSRNMQRELKWYLSWLKNDGPKKLAQFVIFGLFDNLTNLDQIFSKFVAVWKIIWEQYSHALLRPYQTFNQLICGILYFSPHPNIYSWQVYLHLWLVYLVVLRSIR